MGGTAKSTVEHASPALEAYLARAVPALEPPLDWQALSGGQSNPSWLISSAGGQFVLRQAPVGDREPGAHSMEREYRVLRALRDSSVPVPTAYLYCNDRTLIGAEFYVMDYVPGRVFWDPALGELSSRKRRGIYDAMNECLAAIHNLDPAAWGLTHHGRAGSYIERQLKLWSAMPAASHEDDLARAARILAERTPAASQVRLLHGDYRLDNLIYEADTPKVAAIIDWELSTLGDPLSELGFQCAHWRMPRGLLRGFGSASDRPDGIPDEEAYCSSYCQRRGLGDLPDWRFYLAFGFFRLAGILNGIRTRVARGTANHPAAREYAEFAAIAVAHALATITAMESVR